LFPLINYFKKRFFIISSNSLVSFSFAFFGLGNATNVIELEHGTARKLKLNDYSIFHSRKLWFSNPFHAMHKEWLSAA
jgi:hypothetical protein